MSSWSSVSSHSGSITFSPFNFEITRVSKTPISNMKLMFHRGSERVTCEEGLRRKEVDPLPTLRRIGSTVSSKRLIDWPFCCELFSMNALHRPENAILRKKRETKEKTWLKSCFRIFGRSEFCGTSIDRNCSESRESFVHLLARVSRFPD